MAYGLFYIDEGGTVMITYNKKQHIFKIDTRNTSYIMAVADNGYLGHVYYGEN